MYGPGLVCRLHVVVSTEPSYGVVLCNNMLRVYWFSCLSTKGIIMSKILTGRYHGPIAALRGQRAMILSHDRNMISDTVSPSMKILVQWDNMAIWKAKLEDTGASWEKHRLYDFDDYYTIKD